MKYLSIAIPLFWLCIIASSCTEGYMKTMVVAPPATIEREVKGHEQIYSVQAILRMAHRREKNANNPLERTYAAYNIGHQKTPIPIYQEITFFKNDEGNMTITSDRKVFDVVKSKNTFYALELRYFDANNQLINHQFSGFYPNDEDINNSTLAVHQHFFTIQNYALKQEDSNHNLSNGYLLVYPMSIDSVYYDRYMFDVDYSTSERIPASITSSSCVFAPTIGHTPNSLKYNHALAQKAIEVTYSPDAIHPFEWKNKSYTLYKTIDAFRMNELVPEIFTYEYRDTDPVEEELGQILNEPDDLGRIIERLNVGNRVIRLRKERNLSLGADLDHLGFKGILQFHHSNIVFQMRVALCHIISSADNKGKYDMYSNPGSVRNYNELNKSWNSYDIDYPIPFRVMGDADGEMDTFIKDIKHIYPTASDSEIRKMFDDNYSYFIKFPQITM